MAPKTRKSRNGSKKSNRSSSRSHSRSSSAGRSIKDIGSESGTGSESRTSLSEIDSRDSLTDSLFESLSGSDIGTSSRSRSSRRSRRSSKTPSRRSSRSFKSARSCKCRCGSSRKSILRNSKKSKKSKPVGKFARVRDEETREQVREFLHLYSQDDNFDAFTINVDDIPFVAVSLINAETPLLSKYFGAPPPPTPMKPSSNYLSGPRKRRNVSDFSANDSPISSKNKSVRFDDESVNSPKSSSGNISEVLNTSQKGYSDLWKERASKSK